MLVAACGSSSAPAAAPTPAPAVGDGAATDDAGGPILELGDDATVDAIEARWQQVVAARGRDLAVPADAILRARTGEAFPRVDATHVVLAAAYSPTSDDGRWLDLCDQELVATAEPGDPPPTDRRTPLARITPRCTLVPADQVEGGVERLEWMAYEDTTIDPTCARCRVRVRTVAPDGTTGTAYCWVRHGGAPTACVPYSAQHGDRSYLLAMTDADVRYEASRGQYASLGRATPIAIVGADSDLGKQLTRVAARVAEALRAAPFGLDVDIDDSPEMAPEMVIAGTAAARRSPVLPGQDETVDVAIGLRLDDRAEGVVVDQRLTLYVRGSRRNAWRRPAQADEDRWRAELAAAVVRILEADCAACVTAAAAGASRR
ncbi:MAG: hypothetical protein H6708_22060 [Kofleriaceae bacterium]|nr:hypothetical protein [Kofleriaceae bacterium]